MSMAGNAQKPVEAPRVDGFKITAKLKAAQKEVITALSSVSFLQCVQDKGGVSALYVESRDIDKKPYLFSIFKFMPEGIEVTYTIVPNTAPRKRKLDTVRILLNLLTYLDNAYDIGTREVFQLVDAAMKDMNEFVSMDYSKLYVAYDMAKKDLDDLTRRTRREVGEIETLRRENYELKTKNDEMTFKLRQLESMSDATLKEKVQTWVSEHSGEINISEFSKFYNIQESRVEDMLNSLVKEGYLQSIQ
jgi:hypothetical protein